MNEKNETLCVGLFGTCDKSTWRDPFIAKYKELGINYFNPVVEDWTPGCLVEEKQHFENDQVLLFPILDESYGQGRGSKARETSWAWLQYTRTEESRRHWQNNG